MDQNISKKKSVSNFTISNNAPFLWKADSVHILAISLAPEQRGKVPDLGICQHLARHDIRASPTCLDSETEVISGIMLSKAKELDIDLIIMGAYGRSRLREKILGGTTYHLLNHSTVSLLLKH